jgi:hypothetical protein
MNPQLGATNYPLQDEEDVKERQRVLYPGRHVILRLHLDGSMVQGWYVRSDLESSQYTAVQLIRLEDGQYIQPTEGREITTYVMGWTFETSPAQPAQGSLYGQFVTVRFSDGTVATAKVVRDDIEAPYLRVYCYGGLDFTPPFGPVASPRYALAHEAKILELAQV